MNTFSRFFSNIRQNVRDRVRREGKRKLVQETTEVTHLQRLGFILIALGLFFMLYDMILRSHFTGASALSNASAAPTMAVLFFIIMLGVAFAFPSLLRGNEGISTMRIVVFMMANVICMLLIKMGWKHDSLEKIGLDEWWMGVIAFVFGAKATQSFFESRMAVPGAANKTESLSIGQKPVSTSEAIAEQAVKQHAARLKSEHPNILTISDAVQDLSRPDSHVVSIHIKDNNTDGIPAELKAMMPDGEKTIATQIIRNCGDAEVQIAHSDTIANSKTALQDFGSICCAVKSLHDENFTGIVTSAHIYSKGRFDTTNNTVLNPSLRGNVSFDGDILGKWFYKQLMIDQDLIVVKLNDPDEQLDIKQFNNCYYSVTKDDVHQKREVTILSREGKSTKAYILDCGVDYPIGYIEGFYTKKNVILLGSTTDRENSQRVSEKGDSGSCVFVNEGGVDKMIGILVGANRNFTFVHPIKDTLYSNFTII